MWLEGHWYSKIPKSVIVIFSLIVVPAAMLLAITADINLYAGLWPIFPSILATCMGIFLAFLTLGLPVIPLPAKSWRYILADRGFVFCAALPALFFGTYLMFRYPDESASYFIRIVLVTLSMTIGIVVKNLDVGTSQLPSQKARTLDLVRQLVLMSVIFYGVLLYVYMPAFR